MKTIRTVILAIVALSFVTIAYAQQYPKPTGYVNDFAQLFTQEQGKSLNDELVAFEKETTIEITVVTVPWLNNQNIEDYTRGLAKEWGVGKRDQNNGVVFLIAPKERKMRIEIASGVCATLTDNRADQIRDSVVLPRFKAGNMAQGMIDGTHAIMQALNSDPANTEKSTAPAQQLREWTSDDTKILGYVLGSIAGVVLLLAIIVTLVLRSKARKYVLENKDEIASQFAEAERMARSADVKEETRKKLVKLKRDFFSIDNLDVTSEGVKWIEMREKLDSMNYSLSDIVSDIKQEIAFAEKARKEGPELMAKIPGMIEAAEKKLTEGKQSQEAIEYLQEARTQYVQAQAQQSGMTVMDWVILYVVLTSVMSNVEHAESAHTYANTDHSDDYSSRSSDDSSSSYGFGDSGGFGGGGGFDGGGSSGSW